VWGAKTRSACKFDVSGSLVRRSYRTRGRSPNRLCNPRAYIRTDSVWKETPGRPAARGAARVLHRAQAGGQGAPRARDAAANERQRRLGHHRPPGRSEAHGIGARPAPCPCRDVDVAADLGAVRMVSGGVPSLISSAFLGALWGGSIAYYRVHQSPRPSSRALDYLTGDVAARSGSRPAARFPRRGVNPHGRATHGDARQNARQAQLARVPKHDRCGGAEWSV
jgi:hypothetical protein